MNALEEMVFFGQLHEDFDIIGHKVGLRLLNSGEDADAIKAASGYGYDIFTREVLLGIEILSRAIDHVDGLRFQNVKKTRVFIRDLQPSIRELILDKYKELRDLQSLDLEAKRREVGELIVSPFLEDSSTFSEPSQSQLQENGSMES
ncbi:MAG: hypothetical protein KJ760_19190 [Proteobacteria bacterium]|nr:hypothetical protein [Pseudomonadota bacterium]